MIKQDQDFSIQALGLQLYKKRVSDTVFSCEFCEISKNTSFTENLQTTASDYLLGLCNTTLTKNFRARK